MSSQSDQAAQQAEALERQRAEALAGCSLPGCDRFGDASYPPRHMGSARCRSGSLASGGWRSHCTCDACF